MARLPKVAEGFIRVEPRSSLFANAHKAITSGQDDGGSGILETIAPADEPRTPIETIEQRQLSMFGDPKKMGIYDPDTTAGSRSGQEAGKAGEQVGTSGKCHIGMDITFSMPKSASILAYIGDDKRLLDAENWARANGVALTDIRTSADGDAMRLEVRRSVGGHDDGAKVVEAAMPQFLETPPAKAWLARHALKTFRQPKNISVFMKGQRRLLYDRSLALSRERMGAKAMKHGFFEILIRLSLFENSEFHRNLWFESGDAPYPAARTGQPG